MFGAFHRAGCRAILLKGPTLQRALYDDSTRRDYRDTDLLVAPSDLARCGMVLRELGFALVMDHRDHAAVTEPHAQEWRRTTPAAAVDLHWRIPGVATTDEVAWALLSARATTIGIGGARGEALDLPGIALLVALHAAHHGLTHPRPLRDLDRALERVGVADWRAAGRLAAELDASEALAAGLGLNGAGRELAAELRLAPVSSPRRRILASSQPPASLGLLRILEAPTARGRAVAAARELVPSPDLIRSKSSLGRRGAAGLTAAYLARALARAWRLPSAVRAVRRSRPPARPAS